MLALKYVEIHLKHSNRTYKKVTSFLVMMQICLVFTGYIIFVANYLMLCSTLLSMDILRICSDSSASQYVSSHWFNRCGYMYVYSVPVICYQQRQAANVFTKEVMVYVWSISQFCTGCPESVESELVVALVLVCTQMLLLQIVAIVNC